MVTVDLMDENLQARVELERLLHELNPEQAHDYVVRQDFPLEAGADRAVTVAFNVRVRTRATH